MDGIHNLGILDAQFFDGLVVILDLVPDVHPYHDQSAVGVLFVQWFERFENFLATRSAPRRPKIDDGQMSGDFFPIPVTVKLGFCAAAGRERISPNRRVVADVTLFIDGYLCGRMTCAVRL